MLTAYHFIYRHMYVLIKSNQIENLRKHAANCLGTKKLQNHTQKNEKVKTQKLNNTIE